MARRGQPGRAKPGEDEGAFWREVKTGDFISLSDSEAFEASLASGGGASLDYRVGQIRAFTIRGREDFIQNARTAAGVRGGGWRDRASILQAGAPVSQGEFRFIELSPASEPGSPGPLYLAAIDRPEQGSDTGSFELRLYFIPAGLAPGSRDDYIDRGDAWLFLPPSDPEDFISSELEYAPYPDVPEIEEAGQDGGPSLSRKLIFTSSVPSCLYTEASDTGAPAIIAEYCAETPEGESPPANPHMLVLEEGWMRVDGSEPEEGGYVTVMLGKVMRASDVEHWPA